MSAYGVYVLKVASIDGPVPFLVACHCRPTIFVVNLLFVICVYLANEFLSLCVCVCVCLCQHEQVCVDPPRITALMLPACCCALAPTMGRKATLTCAQNRTRLLFKPCARLLCALLSVCMYAQYVCISIIYLLRSTEQEDAHTVNTRTRAGQERHRKLALTFCP